MLRPALVRRDKGKVNVGGGIGGELALGLLRRLLETLEGHVVTAQVDPLVLLKFIGDVIDQNLVKIISSEMSIAIGRKHLEEALVHLENRDIEGSSSEIENGDLLTRLLALEPIRQRRGGRLVDDPLNLQPGDLAGILGRLALRIVEIRRHRDDGLFDLLAKIALGSFLEILQHDGGDLRRCVALTVDLHLDQLVIPPTDRVGNHFFFAGDLGMTPPHEALDRENRTVRVGDGLALGRHADQAALVGKGHDAGSDPVSIRVGDDGRFFAFHYCHDRIRGSKIDSDDFGH